MSLDHVVLKSLVDRRRRHKLLLQVVVRALHLAHPFVVGLSERSVLPKIASIMFHRIGYDRREITKEEIAKLHD